jgi:uncharacterized membrane protein (UPF0127 family)
MQTLHIQTANNFRQRLQGLLFRPALQAHQALLITRCNSVHTCFMGYALDLAYLDAQGQVLGVVHNLKPWRLSWGPRGSRQVLEMRSGSLARLGMAPGQTLACVPARPEKAAP